MAMKYYDWGASDLEHHERFLRELLDATEVVERGIKDDLCRLYAAMEMQRRDRESSRLPEV